ncbi:LamG domain-containing protein [Algibacter sp.]|nr:LamG domain-containing protein [Algibacter sp.]
MFGNRLIKSNNAGAACTTDTVQILGDTSCIAYYKMSDATDETGSYDGTATNVNFNVAGKFGNAGEFNGSSSYISVPNSAGNNMSTFSVSLWFKISNASALGTLISNGLGADNGYYLGVNVGGTIVFLTSDGNSNTATSTSPSTYADGNWHNVVLAYTAVGVGTSTYNIYVDGNSTPVITGSNGKFTGTSAQPLTIGKLANSSLYYYNGSIDQVRIFNRAITANEVTTLYNEVQCIPTIVPTDYFEPVIYTGNGGTQPISTLDFAPDLVWIKSRSNTWNHNILDTIRGDASYISSDTTNAATIASGYFNFDSNGFTVIGGGGINQNNDTFVSWNWKAGGPDVQNTEGTITSQVSANTEAGFSIVSYAGNSAISATIGHGLDSAPQIIISKALNLGAGWPTMFNNSLSAFYGLRLNDSGANNTGNGSAFYRNTPPTSSVYTVGGSDEINDNYNYIAYCFHSVDGYSKIGSYVGNGSATGPTIVTGFEPAFVMVKNTTGTGLWLMSDNKRQTAATKTTYLQAQSSDAEYSPYTWIEYLSNGFQLKNIGPSLNTNGSTYIFMAFAADPAPEPVLANSFNTVTYTGDGGSNRAVTGVGFQPDLTWIKSRSINYNHQLHDSVRGAGVALYSDLTNADGQINTMNSFDSDGFTVNASSFIGTNASGQTFVAWNWKAAEIPAINNNGSITSIVSANPAAGFSIVSYTGTGSVGSIGHGLSSAPELIIMKNRDGTNGWVVRSSALGNGYVLLNSSTAYSSTAFWGTPTDSVFSITSSSSGTILNDKHIAYCFHSVDSYQKVGSYSGNSTSGRLIQTDFAVRWVMIKATNAPSNWFILDSERGGTNDLRANSSNAEEARANGVTFVSNGFELDDTSVGFNNTGTNYIYLAIA